MIVSYHKDQVECENRPSGNGNDATADATAQTHGVEKCFEREILCLKLLRTGNDAFSFGDRLFIQNQFYLE